MAKKKSSSSPKKPSNSSKKKSSRIILKTGEALVEEAPAWSAAEPEVVIGELDGPVGYAIAQLIGNQVKGHTKVFAILNSDVQIRPATVMVSINSSSVNPLTKAGGAMGRDRAWNGELIRMAPTLGVGERIRRGFRSVVEIGGRAAGNTGFCQVAGRKARWRQGGGVEAAGPCVPLPVSV